MPIRTFRFGPMKPDEGPYFNVQEGQTLNLQEANGVIKVNGGYAIQPFWGFDIVDYSGAAFDATNRCGIFSYSQIISGYENAYLLANATTIRQVDHLGAADVDVTRAAGFTNVVPDNYWQFAVYGGRVIATNGIDAIQSKTLDSASIFAKNNTVTAPVSADPRATFVESFKDHLFIGDFNLTAGTTGGETYGGAYGALAAQRYPNGIWWSATDNSGRFSDPATTPSIIGSDYRLMNDKLGGVIGMKAATDYLMVSRVGGVSIFTGPPFQRTDIETTVGGLFSNSLVRVNNDIYAMSRVGPVVIENGSAVRRIGTKKINRWLMQIKNILSDSQPRLIYGARNITGDYIYWTFRDYSDSSPGTYTHLLAYSVDEEEFSIVKTNTVLSSTFQSNEVNMITSYQVPYLSTYDYGDGVAGFGSITTGLGTFNSLLTLKRDVGSTGFISPSSIRTSYVGIGDSNKVFQVWKPKRIRPIFSVDRYNSGLQTIPSGWSSVFSNIVSSIDVFPRNRYSGVDVNYAITGESSVAGTFNTCSSMNSDGWFNVESVPSAHFHGFRFNITGVNSLNVFQFVGFDMEFETLGQTGSGQELVY